MDGESINIIPVIFFKEGDGKKNPPHRAGGKGVTMLGETRIIIFK
jgi:hypothetical protein